MTLAEFVNKLIWEVEGGEKVKAFSADLEEIGKRTGAAARRGILAAGAAATAFLGFSFKTAAAAEELDSQLGVVFEDNADRIREWAEVTGDSLGRSTQELQRSAVAFQSLFGQAVGGDEAVKLSQDFSVLVQDLASFKDLSNEVAQQKLFSGLSGEAEPLRQVGVFLDAASVNAKVLELGLAKTTKEITDQNKIVARAALIRQALVKADGDVIRTQDSATNQLKTLTAEFEELRVEIGTELLPIVVAVARRVSAFVKRLKELNEETDGAVTKILLFAAGAAALLVALTPFFAFFSGLTKIFLAYNAAVAAGTIVTGSFTAVAAPIIVIILAIIAAITAIILVWRNWDKIVDTFNTKLTILRARFVSIAGYLTQTFAPLLARISAGFERVQAAASFAGRVGLLANPAIAGTALRGAASSVANNFSGNNRSNTTQNITNEINVRGSNSDFQTGRAVRDALTDSYQASRRNGDLVGSVGF